jgi:DNA-binding transcriptional regulator GbsR (MarR family)
VSGLGDAEKIFIDGMGVAAATSGVLTQAQGRIFAFIYLRDEPASLEEIAGSLQMAKSSVSVNLKALVEWQLVKRVTVPGSRKDHYEGASDFWRVLQEIVERRFRWNLRQVLATVEETKRAMGPEFDSSKVAQRIETIGQFAAAIEEGMAAFSSGRPWQPDEARKVASVTHIGSKAAQSPRRRGASS